MMVASRSKREVRQMIANDSGSGRCLHHRQRRRHRPGGELVAVVAVPRSAIVGFDGGERPAQLHGGALKCARGCYGHSERGVRPNLFAIALELVLVVHQQVQELRMNKELLTTNLHLSKNANSAKFLEVP